MQKIDPARWPRAEKFGFFSAVSQPFYSATFRVDVTRLHAYTKRHGLSFYYALVYLATNAVNAVENFRYTVRGGEIFLLDERIPSGNNVKFKDIDPDMWYAGYVEYLTGYGVAVGYNDRTYRGDKAITRAEFTAMAARFFDVYGDGAEEIMEQYEGFDDVSDGYWAAEYIKDAAIHGWVEGYGDGTFRADDPIDRAEVVTIVNRLLGREADEDYIADNHRRLVMLPRRVLPPIGPTTTCWRPPTPTPPTSPNPETWEK